jgi:hypothetical protein
LEEDGWMDASKEGELQAEVRRLRGELAMSHNAVRLLLMEVEALREWRDALEFPYLLMRADR